MTFFFMYHPSSVAWLPAPDQLYDMDGAGKKRKKKTKKQKEEEKRRRKKEEEELLLLESLGAFDDD